MIQDKNKIKHLQDRIYESDFNEENLKEICYTLNEKTYTFFKLKSIVRKTSVIKEISNTLDKIADENFEDLMNILD